MPAAPVTPYSKFLGSRDPLEAIADSWIRFDTALDGRTALDTFAAIAGMNLAFFQQLTPAERDVAFFHPEYGNLTVEWVIHQIAGHQINHLQQLQRIE